MDEIRVTTISAFTGHTASVYGLCLGSTSDSFLSGGGDGKVVEWDLAKPGHGRAMAQVGEAIFSLYLDPGRGILLVGAGSGRLHVIDVARGEEIHVFDLHRKGIFRILSYPGGFYCAGGDGILSRWTWSGSTVDGKDNAVALERQIPLCEEKLRDLAFSPEGDRIAVACGDGTLRELETTLLNETLRINAHEGGASSVAYHPYKPVLISGGKDGHLRSWHIQESGRALHSMAILKGSIYSTGFDPEGKWLITAGREPIVKLWDAGSLDQLYRSARGPEGHTHSVNATLWLGDTLITASDDRTVKAWSFGRSE